MKSSKVIPPDRNFNRPVWRVKKASLGEVLNPGKQVTMGEESAHKIEQPHHTWEGSVKEPLLDHPQVETKDTLTQGDSQEYDKSSSEVEHWQKMIEALQAPPTNAMPSKQNELLELMEKLEGHSDEDIFPLADCIFFVA